MSVVCFDPGLRHLAVCCMSGENTYDIKSYQIHFWGVFDIFQAHVYRCKTIQKNGRICDKKCSLKYFLKDELNHSCKIHFPKNLDYNTKEYILKKRKVKDYTLEDIAKHILDKIQEIFDTHLVFLNIQKIFIELQPKINPKAVFTSHIIYGKLVDLYKKNNVKIRFIKASYKLRAYTGPPIQCKLKGSYSRRKWLSVQYTYWFLRNKFSQEQKDKWLIFFEETVVKPDLGDTFLMAINALCGIKKLNFFDKIA